MSLRPFAVDILYVERALQMSYGFSTRLTHANKISIAFKANKGVRVDLDRSCTLAHTSLSGISINSISGFF